MAGLNREIVRELLHYDPETGVFTWLARGERWFKTARDCQSWNTRYSGKRAGRVLTFPKTGYQYRGIRVLGRDCKEHRLAWLYMTDEPLPSEIDHKSRDGTDNRWSNLRSSTRANNSRNRSMPRNNTSGITGVTWHKPTGRWLAGCKINGVRHNLGRFDDLDDAAKKVKEFRAEHGFDPGHGCEFAIYHGR